MIRGYQYVAGMILYVFKVCDSTYVFMPMHSGSISASHRFMSITCYSKRESLGTVSHCPVPVAAFEKKKNLMYI